MNTNPFSEEFAKLANEGMSQGLCTLAAIEYARATIRLREGRSIDYKVDPRTNAPLIFRGEMVMNRSE